MAGATHSLPVVIQYVLYNSTRQQSPPHGHPASLKPRTQRKHVTHTQSLYPHICWNMGEVLENPTLELVPPAIQSAGWSDHKTAGQPVRQIIRLSVCQPCSCALSHPAVQQTKYTKYGKLLNQLLALMWHTGIAGVSVPACSHLHLEER